MQKICILASGGDCPGMNACVEAIYKYAKANGMNTVAAMNGFDGLVDDVFVNVTDTNATGISHKSGCVFGCSRSPRIKEHQGFKSAVSNIKKHGIDAMIVIGGNGSLVGAGRFKNAGINVTFIPGTIDNDVPGHKHSIGFSSACENSVKLIDTLKATMETSERDHIVQLMGRHCNELTQRVGIATFADVIDMEGARVTAQQVANVFVQNRKAGKTSNFMIMQERKAENAVKERLEDAKFLNEISRAAKSDNIRMSVLGYLQRGASPSCHDRFLAVLYGKAAVECIAKKQCGMGVAFINDGLHLLNIELAPIP